MKSRTSELILLLSEKFPKNVDEYFFIRDWYEDGDEYISGKYLKNGNEVKTDLTLAQHKNIISIAKEISGFLKDEDVNRISIVFRKDGSHSQLVEMVTTLDSDRESETRAAIGNELYEKLDEQRKNFEPVEDESLNITLDEMNKGQLLGLIYQNLGKELEKKGINWDRIVLKASIELDDYTKEKSIETFFYYVTLEDKVEFDPENPIGTMNAISQIRDKMIEEGKNWNKSEITIHRNGEVDLKV